MSKIKSLFATEIIDSRGNPTLETLCVLDSGFAGKMSIPSGISTGKFEALELRDGDLKRFDGKGVLNAIYNVNKIINDSLIDKNLDQFSLDDALNKLDGTENKSNLGANALLGVSLSFAKAKASEEGKELFEYLGSLMSEKDFKIPNPAFNIINGGKHSDSGLDIQEFMICPFGIDDFDEQLRAGAEIIYKLKELLISKGYSVSVGDEGGFAPHLKSNEEAFELIREAIKLASYSDHEIGIAIDVAATSFFDGEFYNLKIDGFDAKLKSDGLISWYKKLISKYGIMSIEDGFSEEDWDGFSKFKKECGHNLNIVGDDLTVTNIKKIEEAEKKDAINSVLIKPNQIGTLSETLRAISLTKKYNWKPFVSHRSGETTDTFISDLAVGLSCPYIKAGSLNRGERVCKYNRLSEIERKLRQQKD